MSSLTSGLAIFLIAILGYMSAKKELISEQETNAISKFAFAFAIPVLLFYSAARSELPSTIEWTFLLSFYGPVALVFLLAIFAGSSLFRSDEKTQSVFGVSSTYSNTTILGIPLCLELLGEASLVPLFVILCVQNIFIFTLGVLAAERDSLTLAGFFHYLAKTFEQFVRSPILLSVALGLLFNLFNVQFLSVLDEALLLFSRAAIPVALFVMGASLSYFRFSIGLSSIWTAVLLKNVALPVLVYLAAFHLFKVDFLWGATATLAAAMPIGISAYVFSQKYQVWTQQAASSILVSTLLSLVTLGGWSVLLKVD
jgi:predicted permease